MQTPFGETQRFDGAFQPFPPGTPQSAMKMPEAVPYAPSANGDNGPHPPETARDSGGAFAPLVGRLNASLPSKGLAPFAVEREGNVIRIGRMRSIPADSVAQSESERRRVADAVARLKAAGIMPESRLVDEDAEEEMR